MNIRGEKQLKQLRKMIEEFGDQNSEDKRVFVSGIILMKYFGFKNLDPQSNYCATWEGEVYELPNA